MTQHTYLENHIGILGAGPVGSLLAIYLAQRGITSDLYERRPDMRSGALTEGRSINLAVSTRGLHALHEIGLEEHILTQAIPMRGRMIHSISGKLTFQPYGISEKDCIYSMSRSGLNQALMTRAEDTGNVRIHFQNKATGFDLNTNTLTLWNEAKQDVLQVNHTPLIATDGSGSVIRSEMMKLPNYQCTQDYLAYGYKELTLPMGSNGSFLLEKNVLHIWPRGAYMLIALPNLDGSFTCTLFLSHQGQPSFEVLNSTAQVTEFFEAQFPDIIPLMPDFSEQFFLNPMGQMVTVKCSPWHVSDRLLLLGDAAHAIVPFFGQGMNCGFEDCTVLNQMLGERMNWEHTFSRLSALRKANTDGIADMAIENFVEMRDKVAQSHFLMEKAVEGILQKAFPGEYVSRYALVTFSRVPYQVAYQAGVLENEILSELCRNINRAEDVDLEKARYLIRTKLKPLLAAQKGLNYGSSN